jgi:hypothetical protein
MPVSMAAATIVAAILILATGTATDRAVRPGVRVAVVFLAVVGVFAGLLILALLIVLVSAWSGL